MNAHAELFEAVQIYFEGLFYCDEEKLDAVFHPTASLFDVEKGEIFAESIASFNPDVGANAANSPYALGQQMDAEILMVDYMSPKAALVKIRFRARRNVYQDHLSMLKGENGWQIVAKVWMLETVIEDI
ncbi:nuclear transport factor 2 family protein [Shimia sagamensis]|uniref:Lumazine-binding n=1 Tax=Shimia sagamensis TaxID=1566352 RepID=A0ABY1NWJ9_9RHOB|nr:nuclear transport factor 2 family protein [Shimia sagamensis]SMP18760.1 Putative lumazine-binding [Shimia sagamensis]